MAIGVQELAELATFSEVCFFEALASNVILFIALVVVKVICFKVIQNAIESALISLIPGLTVC
jgi:uncharacterized membrane protein YjjP (DUF1212 family)